MTTSEQYWFDSITEIFPDHGLDLPVTRLEAIAGDLALSGDMLGEVTGQCAIPNPREEEVRRLKVELDTAKQEAVRREDIFCHHIAGRLSQSTRPVHVSIEYGRVVIDGRLV